MNYSHELKNLPKSQVEITVTIPADQLESFLSKAAALLSTKTEIKGFRPGKAPLEIIKKQFGEMKVYEEAAALAVEKSYVEIVTAVKLEPLGSPKIEFIKLAPGNEFVYKATVTLVPEVKLGKIDSVKIKEKTITISEENISKVVEELRESRAKEVLENKPAAKGDKVEMDFEVIRDNVPIEGGAEKKYPLIIGSGQFIPGFEENLIGLKANDTKEFELKFPDQYHNNNLAGKPAKFIVKILAVYKRELPGLDDEFAKSLGLADFAKLKEQIKHNLEHEEHHKEEERIERELMEELIKKSSFGEIPDILVTAEANKMIQELESNIMMQGLKFEDYLKHLNKTKEQLKLEFAPQALKRVQGALLMRAIFFQEKFQITDQEIDQEIELMSKYYQQNPEIINNLKTPEYRDYVSNMIGNRKVMDFLKTTCVIREEKNKKIKHNH
jgi:trigger factor